MQEDERLKELEHHADIEAAKLGVAEEIGWVVAILAAVVVHLKWGGWLFPALAFVGSYYLATYHYRRGDSAAEDAYHRAACIGKYYVHPKDR